MSPFAAASVRPALFAAAIVAAGLLSAAAVPASAAEPCAIAAPKAKRGLGLGGLLSAVGAAACQNADKGTGQSSDQPAGPARARPAAAPAVRYPNDIPVSPEIAAQKEAFVEFSRYSCNDCEGGRGYDAWVRQALAGELYGYNAFEKKIGGMALGEKLSWNGVHSKGTLTITGEQPVDGFPCKQLTYRLVKGNATAERRGLFCFGKSSPYSASDSWVEVY